MIFEKVLGGSYYSMLSYYSLMHKDRDFNLKRVHKLGTLIFFFFFFDGELATLIDKIRYLRLNLNYGIKFGSLM